jgi:nucleotide-binding universal stress UspA family protein
LDQSPPAEQALSYAEALALRLGLPIRLILAQPPVYLAFTGPRTGAYPPALHRMIRDAEQAAMAYLDARAAALRGRGCEVDVLFRHGAPAEEIVAAAQANGGSLVVMSTQGRSGFGRALLGSVASSVVRTSGKPVLLIRAQPDS